MDGKIKSPPKPVRVVHMSPAGVICSPLNAKLHGNLNEYRSSVGGSMTPVQGLSQPVITTPTKHGEEPPSILEPATAKAKPTPNQIPKPAATGEIRIKEETKTDSKTKDNDTGVCVKNISDIMTSSSIELEGMLVEKAVRTLPQVVNEVAVMHKGQQTEIQRNEINLRDLKAKRTLAKEKNEEILQEISSVTHKIYLTEEDTKESSKKCKRYKRELDGLVSECEHIKREIARKKEIISEEERLYELYQNKMENFIDLVRKQESESAIHKEVQALQDRVRSLSEKKKMVINRNDFASKGELAQKIDEKIEDTKMNISLRESQLLAISTEIIEEKEKQTQTEQSILVLHKKNAAQMTRLKNQVREVNMRSRRWKDQIIQLEKTIKELTQRLEE